MIVTMYDDAMLLSKLPEFMAKRPGAVAEWVERLCSEREIPGSNPASYLC